MIMRNHRRHERVPSGTLVKLRWRTPSGDVHFGRGRILDHSAGGLRVELGEPLQQRLYITLEAPELKASLWSGWASVRHCTQKVTKYVVGLEFSAGARWDC